VREWADATWGVVRRDAIVFLTYRSQVLTMIVGTLFQLTIFYFIAQLLHARTFATSTAYFAFVVVGMAIMQSLVTTLGLTPAQVRQELVAGTMERFLVSPFGAGSGIVAMMVFPTLWSLVMGTILLALAAVVFGLPLVATAPLAIPIALLGSLAFMPFTLALVAVVVVFKQATAGTQFLISGIAIVGGLYFPSGLLPGWLRWTSQAQPFTPAADLLRHLLVGSALRASLAADLGKLIGFGIVLFPLALLALRRAIRFGQRRGTIIEY
jgi:ABC-type multidrug transport system permease subunit